MTGGYYHIGILVIVLGIISISLLVLLGSFSFLIPIEYMTFVIMTDVVSFGMIILLIPFIDKKNN